MKTFSTFAVALALVAASASSAVFAEGGTYEQPQVFTSSLTRAQVAAEAAEAQRLGLIGRGELSPVATPDQERAIELAGQRAVSTRVAAGTTR